MKYCSRREFIRGVALTGAAAAILPQLGFIAAKRNTSYESKEEDGLVFLFQGDSITDGKRGRNNDPNHIMGHGYVFSITSRLGADFPERNFTFYNRGISGDKVNDLADRWSCDTLDLIPDILSILVGVNDASSVVFQREPIINVEEYEKDYTMLLERTLSVNPNILFVICEPFILKVGQVKENWDAYYTDIVKRQEVVRRLALKFDAVFVGFQEVFDQACKKAAADYWIWDGVHPTVAGHELMAREWIKQVWERVRFY